MTLHAAGVPDTAFDGMAGHPVTLMNEVPVHALGESQGGAHCHCPGVTVTAERLVMADRALFSLSRRRLEPVPFEESLLVRINGLRLALVEIQPIMAELAASGIHVLLVTCIALHVLWNQPVLRGDVGRMRRVRVTVCAIRGSVFVKLMREDDMRRLGPVIGIRLVGVGMTLGTVVLTLDIVAISASLHLEEGVHFLFGILVDVPVAIAALHSLLCVNVMGEDNCVTTVLVCSRTSCNEAHTGKEYQAPVKKLCPHGCLRSTKLTSKL